MILGRASRECSLGASDHAKPKERGNPAPPDPQLTIPEISILVGMHGVLTFLRKLYHNTLAIVVGMTACLNRFGAVLEQ